MQDNLKFRHEFSHGKTYDTTILEMDIQKDLYGKQFISLKIQDDIQDSGRIVYIHSVETLKKFTDALIRYEYEMQLSDQSPSAGEGEKL